MQVSTKTQNRTVAIWLTNTRVASSPSVARTPASTGTKAWLNAPSANRRRNILGIRNATLKASVMGVAPNMVAISNWRTKPVMREARVKTETKEADLKSDTPHSVAPVQGPPAVLKSSALLATSPNI